MSEASRHLALVGATATGKTALAVAFARAVPRVELVSVDAFAVYRGLDVGAAKPTAAEREGVVWHLLDVFEPSEEYSVAEFQAAGRAAIDEIDRRGGRALLVGGTGLYHRALVDALELPGRFPQLRAELEQRAAEPDGLAELFARLVALDQLAAARMEPTNARRIVRALEVSIGSGRPFSSYGPGLESYGTTPFRQFGLQLDRALLERRIAARLEQQLAAGFVDEVATLLSRPGGLSRTAAQGLGYRELTDYLEGRSDLDAARREILHRTRVFAKRQEAWFRRDPRITWLDATRDDLLRELVTLADGAC